MASFTLPRRLMMVTTMALKSNLSTNIHPAKESDPMMLKTRMALKLNLSTNMVLMTTMVIKA